MTNKLPLRIHIPCPKCKHCNHAYETLTAEEAEHVEEFQDITPFDLDREQFIALTETELICEKCARIIKISLVEMVQIEAVELDGEMYEEQNAPSVETVQ